MTLLNIMNAPWAITSSKFSEIQEVYARHIHGEKLSTEAIKALAHENPAASEGLEIVDDVAIIPINGVIAKRMNLFSEISGGTSTQLIERDFKAALKHPDVKSILLTIDSPGGAVDGTPELANAIYAARGQKPIIAFSDGTMASAAYWIGAAADQVFISGKTVNVGSIGVVATHQDTSKLEEKSGVKTTEIVAGEFKRIASQHEPLTRDGRDSIQAMVDDVYSVFVSDVAKFRGVSEETVVEKMADGRVFMGKKAVKAGLVDGIRVFDGLVNAMANKDIQIEENNMEITKDFITEKYPDIAQAFIKEGSDADSKESFKEGVKSGVVAGADNERQRIQDVESQCIAGHEDLIAGLKFDGKTTGPEAAVKVLEAEKGLRAKVAANIISDAGGAVPSQEPVEPTKEEAVEDKENRLIQEYQVANKCDYRTALLAVSSANPELFK